MILTQKCNCCIHNEVCSKKPLYDGVVRDIKSVITPTREEFTSVAIRCKYFNPNTQEKESANNGCD